MKDSAKGILIAAGIVGLIVALGKKKATTPAGTTDILENGNVLINPGENPSALSFIGGAETTVSPGFEEKLRQLSPIQQNEVNTWRREVSTIIAPLSTVQAPVGNFVVMPSPDNTLQRATSANLGNLTQKDAGTLSSGQNILVRENPQLAASKVREAELVAIHGSGKRSSGKGQISGKAQSSVKGY